MCEIRRQHLQCYSASARLSYVAMIGTELTYQQNIPHVLQGPFAIFLVSIYLCVASHIMDVVTKGFQFGRMFEGKESVRSGL